MQNLIERKLGILTQCVTMKSVKRANDQLAGMVLMKINAKIGGACSSVDLRDWSAQVDTRLLSDGKRQQIFDAPTMIVGISINSTAKTLNGSTRACSVGLSFSVDQGQAQYLMVAGKSVDGKTVDQLDLLMKDAIISYYKKQSSANPELCKPRFIIVYRTGTSDGEKGIITRIETEQIKKAFSLIEKDYK